MNLSKMGFREIKEASKILNHISENGYPENCDGEDIDIDFNENSGCVYMYDKDMGNCL